MAQGDCRQAWSPAVGADVQLLRTSAMFRKQHQQHAYANAAIGLWCLLGADAGPSKSKAAAKKEDEERKRAEAAAKKAEAKRLLEEEEARLASSSKPKPLRPAAPKVRLVGSCILFAKP